MAERLTEARSGWTMWRNLETGLVRRFWGEPRHGKWKRTTLRSGPAIGRRKMAEIVARSEGGNKP